MDKIIQVVITSEEKPLLRQILNHLATTGKHYFLRNEILQAFAECSQFLPALGHAYHSSALSQLVLYTHEIIVEENSVWLVVRP